MTRSSAPAALGPVTLPETGVARSDPSAALVVAVWIAVTISQVALSLSEPKAYTPITDGPQPIPVWADRIGTAMDALVLLACAAAVVVGLRRGARPHDLALFAVLVTPWVALVGRQALSGGSIGPGILPYLALAGSLWLVRPRFGLVEAIGYLTAAGALLAVVLAVVAPAAGLYTGGPGYLAEKPIGPWGILAGFLPTGNNMGRYLAIGLPSVLAIRNARHRWLAGGVTVVALVWTASRTSIAGVAATAAVLVALRLATRYRPAIRTWVATVALGGLGVVVVVLPFLVTAAHQFNHRAGYWMFLLDQWRATPWIGHGLDYFARLATEPQNLGGYAYHAHNLAVQVLVTGGLLAAVPVAAVLVLAARRAVRLAGLGFEWPVLVLAVVLTQAVLEVPLSFADDVKANLPAIVPLLVLLLAVPAAGAVTAADAPEAEGAA